MDYYLFGSRVFAGRLLILPYKSKVPDWEKNRSVLQRPQRQQAETIRAEILHWPFAVADVIDSLLSAASGQSNVAFQ